MTPFSAGPPDSDGLTSQDFPVHWPVLTRWADNDMFGHLNNAVYYQLFDTAINGWIQTNVTLDPVTTTAQGIVAESGCRYFSELHFPEQLVVGVSVTRLGNSSCTYRLGIFRRRRRAAGGRGGRTLGARLRRPHQPPTGADSRHHPLAAIDGLRQLANSLCSANAVCKQDR